MRALLSVANREGISTFARELQRLGVELYATDGTRDHLAADGVEVASVSDLTAVPPLVGGQVRTFHPAIYAGILARRDVPAQLEELKAHGLELLDLVVVNVKPFAPEVGRGHIGIDEAIEMIDVAGAALLGAAARNAAGVVAVSDPATTPCSRRDAELGMSRPTRASPGGRGIRDRGRLLRRDRGLPQPDRRQRLPEAAGDGAREGLGPAATARTRTSGRRSTARRPTARGTLADATQLHGEHADVQQPARPRRRLPDRRRLHGADRRHRQAHRPGRRSPRRDELVEAYRRALDTDPVASFGGIVGVNRELDGATAREIAANSYEAVVAPGFTPGGARDPRRPSPASSSCRVPPDPTEGMRDYGIANLDFKRVGGGLLVETLDAARPRPRPAPGRHPAPPDAGAS